MSGSLFFDIGVAVVAAAVLAIVFSFFKQPTILGFVVAGLLIGPVFGIVKDPSVLGNFSELGIALLLFIIGIELDIKRVKQLGISSAIIGILQVAFTGLISYFIVIKFGFTPLEAVYMSLIVAFSSTMVVVKLLSDKNELDSLHGELVLGVLIMQDLIAVGAMTLLATVGNLSPATIALVVGKGAILIISSVALGLVLQRTLRYLVSSKELLFIFAIALCLAFAAWASFLGYSLAIGAFIAGVILGNTEFNYEIAGKITPLRDFFLMIFFVSLGMQLRFSGTDHLLQKVVLATVLVVVLKPVVTFLVTKAFRFGNRTALLASIQLAQVSEFSLILVSAGIALGQISSQFSSITAILTMLTFALTAYTIKFDNSLYRFARPFIRVFERISSKEEILKNLPPSLNDHVVVFGVYRMGGKIIRRLLGSKNRLVVVDYNPEKVRGLLKRGIYCICSDMTNWEIDPLLNLRKAKAVISTIRDRDNNLGLIGRVKKAGSRAIIVVAAFSEEDALKLYRRGADYVVLPDQLGGEHVISNIINKKRHALRKISRLHIENLKEDLKGAVNGM